MFRKNTISKDGFAQQIIGQQSLFKQQLIAFLILCVNKTIFGQMGNALDHFQEKIVLAEDLFRIDGEALNSLLHRSIGSLSWLNKKKQLLVGSGVIISKNIVITAAHNIYSEIEQQEYSDFKFYLGANGVAKDYYEVEEVRYLEEFKTCKPEHNLRYDFAVLKLKANVQYNQFLKLSIACKPCLLKNNAKTQLSICGFPGHYRDNYRCLNLQGNQFKLYQYGLARSNRIVIVDPESYKIGYQISTLPGQSGCPVCIHQTIIGIHNGGGKTNEQFNVARLVDLPLFVILENWCKQFKGDPFQLNSKDLCAHIQTTIKEYLREKEREKKKEERKKYALDMNWQGLTEIDLSSSNHLTEFDLGCNCLASIDVSRNLNLTKLSLSNNQLSMIDVRNNINLTQLDLRHNKISAIDVRNNVNLTRLYLYANKISAIDISRNTKLTHLDLGFNQLSRIDVTKNINLTELNLTWIGLTAIDITNNVNLTSLDLSFNRFSAIDVSKNINLTDLNLWNNNLSAIDVNNNTLLIHLNLSRNKFKHILLLFTSILQYPDFQYQQSTNCEVQMLYKQNESQECQKQIKQWTKTYKKKWFKNRNEHICKYSFVGLQCG